MPASLWAPANDASLISYSASGTSSVARTVKDKLDDFVNIVDKGADKTGVVAATTAFSSAAADGNVFIPPGIYTFPVTPTVGVPRYFQSAPGAAVSGSGILNLGFVAGDGTQLIQWGTSPDQFAASYIRRQANHIGGTSGYVSAALKVESYVSANVTNFEWNSVFKLDNSAAAGENVALYAQGIKRSTGATWAAVFEAIDATGVADPVTGLPAVEVDVRANGTDSNRQRIGIDIVASRPYSGSFSGAAMVAAYGVRLQNAADALASFETGFSVGGVGAGTTTAAVGFDTSAATITQAAYKMAAGQAISFNTSVTRKMYHDGTGFRLADASNNIIMRFTDTGALQGAGGVQVVGAREPGWGVATNGSKAAFNGATATLGQTSAAVAAIIQAMTLHGLIGV